MYRMIYFFGPDGSGKTTHADLVAASLRRRGYKVWRTSIKQHHTIAYLLLKLISMGSYNLQTFSYYGFREDITYKIRKPWKIVEFLGLIPALLYRVYIPMLMGYILVCDRYVLDTLVTLSFFLKDPKIISGSLARILLKLIPKNSLLVYFDAETKTIKARKQDEPLSIELITYYRYMYAFLSRLYNLDVVKIETTHVPINDVQRKIKVLIYN